MINNHNIVDSEKLWFVFSGQCLLLTSQMEIPTGDNFFIQNCQFIRALQFKDIGLSHTIAELPSEIVLPENMQLMDLKKLYFELPTEVMAIAGKARQLLEWDRAHQFCGECGTSTSVATNEYRRTCMNQFCQQVFYPRISPVVIVAVERGSEILLARSPYFPPEIYSLLAGFVEPGESVEQAVHREVYEETGIKIGNLRYFNSQAWPFPNELILGFQADYESGEVICDPKEIEDAAFFHVDALPKTFPGCVTLSQWLLHDFRKRNSGRTVANESGRGKQLRISMEA